jgi:hypothetical protein
MTELLSDRRFFLQFGSSIIKCEEASGGSLYYSQAGPEVKIGFHGPFAVFSGLTPGSEREQSSRLIEKVLESTGVNKVFVRTPPVELYSDKYEVIVSALKEHGFRIGYAETDHVFNLGDEYRTPMSKTNSKNVRRAENLGYLFSSGHEHLEASHQVIEINRGLIAKPQTIPLENKISLRDVLGEAVDFGVVSQGNHSIAGYFSLWLDSKTVYVAQWGDDRGTVSGEKLPPPIPFMFKGMLRKFEALGAKKVYLGSSSEEGVLDVGLSRFKQSLGCVPCQKQVWVLDRFDSTSER